MAVTIRLRYFILGIAVLIAAQAATIPIAVSLAQQGDPSEPAADAPLDYSFTYQGRLTTNNVPANGEFDFVFQVFNQAEDGALAGPQLLFENIVVTNGLFTAVLNFGPGVFEGSERYLRVSVREGSQTGPGNFEQLGPRQQLTATPYALYAKNIPLAGDGTAETAAHSDHNHFGQQWTGSTATQGLFIAQQGSGSGIQVFSKFGASLTASNQTGTGTSAAVRASHSGLNNACPAATENPHDFCVGVWAETNEFFQPSAGIGVYGNGLYGVWGASTSDDGTGVFGKGETGVRGEGDVGVRGEGDVGVRGEGDVGVIGEGQWGVRGDAKTAGGAGVLGDGGSFSTGIVGKSVVGGFAAVFGENPSATGTGVTGIGGLIGVDAYGKTGVQGTSSSGDGVLGLSSTNGFAGVHGQHSTWNGVYGEATSSGTGVAGSSVSGNGVYGTSSTGFAGFFQGKLRINGLSEVGGHVVPAAQNTYDNGFASARWNDIWGANVHYGVLVNDSDARLKTGVIPLAYGLDEVRSLNPVAFSYADGRDDKTHLGLVAQDVQALIPELVGDASDGSESWLTLNYTELIPVLIRAIQEQQEQIQGLGTVGLAPGDGSAGDRQVPSEKAVTPVIGSGAGAAIAVALFGGLALIAVAHTRRRGI